MPGLRLAGSLYQPIGVSADAVSSRVEDLVRQPSSCDSDARISDFLRFFPSTATITNYPTAEPWPVDLFLASRTSEVDPR